ncbi:MAG: hypothetical protein ACYC6J_09755 [Coriobacteriia bacterium]
MKGHEIFCGAKITKKAWEQVGQIMEHLGEALQDRLSGVPGISKCEWCCEDWDGTEDVTTGYICDYGIYLGKRRKPSAHLAFQVLLADEDEAKVCGDVPLLYVLFRATDDKWKTLAFSSDAVHKGYRPDREVGRLLQWPEESGSPGDGLARNGQAWGFVLPLVVLNNPEDLDREILTPTVRLLEGEKPSRAFRDAREVLCFVVEGDTLRSVGGSPG